MAFPTVTMNDWRALVERELAGVPFEKALVHTTAEGLAVEPLYVDAPVLPSIAAPRAFRLCMPLPGDDATIAADRAGGAAAFWQADTLFTVEENDGAPVAVDAEVISLLAYHDAGADAADELALSLGLGVKALRARAVSRPFAVQIAVGRDTFAELCKLRALRICWQKLLTAASVTPTLIVHAVCSSRTLTERDATVNMLRCTTQVFAAILGGADFVSPTMYDEGRSELGRRLARNTALVLREESHLGEVIDPAAGSYYFDSYTDALCREAWKRFQAFEAAPETLDDKPLAARFAIAWQKRYALLAKRKELIVGVSEFANLDEAPPTHTRDAKPHRDAEAFEALRASAKNDGPDKRVALVTLGDAAEYRARVGFARGLFALGGLRVTEADGAIGSAVACICGSDERYASEAADTARRLKANGCKRVLLAGRPGTRELELRAAGVDDFIFVGCDVVAALTPIVELA